MPVTIMMTHQSISIVFKHVFNIDIFLSTIPIAGGLQGGDASALPHQGASIPINSAEQLNNIQFTSNM